ncbi:MAG: CHAT domain-containing protein [Bryobacteraceae bacterium]
MLEGCNRHDPKRAEQAVRQIQSDIQHGPLDHALSLARSNARLWADRDRSEIYLHLKLLEADALLRKGGQAGSANKSLQDLRIAPDMPVLEVQRQILLGQSCIALKQYDEAAKALDRACDQATAQHWDEPLLRALTLKGLLLWQRKQLDSAEAVFRSALKLAERINDPSGRMTALIDVGALLSERSRYDAAVSYLEQALAQQSAGDLQPVSVVLQNLAICYYRLGDFDAALNKIKQAISIQETMNAEGNLISSYGELGNIYQLRGEVPRAVPYYEQALELAVKLHSDRQIELFSLNLATAHIELEEWEQAETLNKQALKIEERIHARDWLPNLQLNTAAIAGHKDAVAGIRKYSEIASAPSKLPPTILWGAHAALAKLYVKTGDKEQAGQHFERALQAIEQKRSELSRPEFKITFLSRLIPFYQDYVAFLIDQGEIGKALEVADNSRARLLAERLNAGLPVAPVSDFRAVARSSNSVLVSYWIAPGRSFVWVVTPDEIHLQPLPESATNIQTLVDSYAAEVERDMRDTARNGSAAGAKLYAAMVEPIRQYLPPGKKVIVVPDGPLHNLNFETLIAPGAGVGAKPHYWIEDVTLSVAPSLALLAQKAVKDTAGRGMLLIGNAEPIEQYLSLPHAEQEIEAIRKHFPSQATKVYVGPAATPSLYKNSHPEQFALIHFTAHADANRESPLDSAVILSKQDDEYKLYGRDVMSTGLHAKLVTVSACKSAGTKAYSGEGLVGFAWAFLHAGANNVIAGLWDVDDSSTARLMDRMYAGLADGDAPDRALRDAKLSLIHGASVNYRKPYYWGPLQVFRRTAQ